MLTISRLQKDKDFTTCIKQGNKINCQYLSFFYKRNNLKICRIGISVSKKICKKAVVRNYIKRQIKSFFYTHNININQFVDVVIVVKNTYNTKLYSQILINLKNKLKQNKLIL